MNSPLNRIMRQLDDMTQRGHYQAAMALVDEARKGYAEDSPEYQELNEALQMLVQMAEMAQFAKEVGVGPGGSHVQEYAPDWTPPDGQEELS